ncbi:MAG: hypothetical protein ACI87W_001735 [Halieaceae bacterium]|jgi:hypothetical protein
MAFVQRGSSEEIVAVSREPQPGFLESIADDDPELREFLVGVGQISDLARTDLEFVRVLEDLLDILMSKNVLLFTELPERAQAKILERQALRQSDDALDILDDGPLV